MHFRGEHVWYVFEVSLWKHHCFDARLCFLWMLISISTCLQYVCILCIDMQYMYLYYMHAACFLTVRISIRICIDPIYLHYVCTTSMHSMHLNIRTLRLQQQLHLGCPSFGRRGLPWKVDRGHRCWTPDSLGRVGWFDKDIFLRFTWVFQEFVKSLKIKNWISNIYIYIYIKAYQNI